MPKVIEFRVEERGMGGSVTECKVSSLDGSTLPQTGQVAVPDNLEGVVVHDWAIPTQIELTLRGDG